VHPNAETVRHELSGQICRCTGYANIVKAIVAAGQEFNPGTDSPTAEQAAHLGGG
jgi:aerobic-type carbon monoxide dehydrogenase small subunit (CoxS/CutS family)